MLNKLIRNIPFVCIGLMLASGFASGSPAFAGRQAASERFAPEALLLQERLELKAAGVAKLAKMLRICAAALYGPDHLSAEQIHASDAPRRIEIEYFVGVSRERLVSMASQSLEAQLDEARWRRFRAGAEKMNSLYTDVRPGDRYALNYHPEGGLWLELNGRTVGRVEADAEFARAYFGIWLGESPVSPGLKRQLLDKGV